MHVLEKSVTCENNDSCKQGLVIILTLHIECNFNLKVFFFHLYSLLRSLSVILACVIEQTHDSFVGLFCDAGYSYPETVIAVIFSLSPFLWASLGENCLVTRGYFHIRRSGGLVPKFASEILVGAPNFASKNISDKYPIFCPLNFRYDPRAENFSQLLSLLSQNFPSFSSCVVNLARPCPKLCLQT